MFVNFHKYYEAAKIPVYTGTGMSRFTTGLSTKTFTIGIIDSKIGKKRADIKYFRERKFPFFAFFVFLST